jgi:plasmid stabilization system protein ParE
MAEIVWSPRAIKDIDEIATYIAKDSLQYAEAQTRLFFSTVEVLERYPYRGRVVPELGADNIRQLLCGHYRIIYEVFSEDEIGILTVHHQARLLKNNPAITRRLRKRGK